VNVSAPVCHWQRLPVAQGLQNRHSQLEAGNGNPSLETLWSLCVALDIPFARLLEPQEQKRR
jgi:transcriptional regulator with XRE-family HTH domain